MGSYRIYLHPKKNMIKNGMMSLSLVKNSGRKLSPQSDVRVGDTGEGHIMRQYSEEKKRRLKSTARDVKTPQLPTRHDTTGKPAKPMMPDAATQSSSSDHFEESSRQYAKWEKKVGQEELWHLQKLENRLFHSSLFIGVTEVLHLWWQLYLC
ncbi:uncharacterized protein [Periplaneta americana]|uniref:uncharacterized protein n=1 Tax=Periplaneta americana TaxID=6978 RepID=UPI0037E93E08